MTQKRYLFFIGSHRTGSKAMATLANQIEGASCIHQNRGHQFLNLISLAYLQHKCPQSFLDFMTDQLLLNRLKNTNKDCVVETIGYNMVAIQRALETLEHMKIIHVIRDPRSFITSMQNWRKGRPTRNKIQENLPFWDVGSGLLKISAKQWNSLDITEKFAHRWAYKNEYISKTYGAHPNYRMIKFENLFNSDHLDETLELLQWGGMHVNKMDLEGFIIHKINVSNPKVEAGDKIPGWRSWNNETCRKIHNICGNNSYGYLQSTEWINVLNNTGLGL